MSRLIVKNLPNKVTVDNLKELFGEKGEVTDVQLKYTKEGKFRNFGFIGFRTEEQAAAAKEYFDGTCIRSMKINVDVCANLGDEKKPRAWSKYAPDSTAYKKLHKEEIPQNVSKAQKKKIEKNNNKIKELLKKHKDDPLFAEFIEAHVNEKTAWIKEAFIEASKSDDEGEEGTEKDDDSNNKVEKQDEPEKLEESKEKVADKQISDLEYMKVLMGKSENIVTNSEAPKTEPKKVRNRPLFHVKILGLPFKCKKKNIKEFFRPIVPFSIRFPLGKDRKLAGFCYVGFRTEIELKKALKKDKLFIGSHRVHVFKYEDQAKKAAEEQGEEVKKRQEEKSNSEESIGESGRIFVRNLPYVVSEEEVTKLFEKYGPLADVHMPLDAILRQPKGFATVTFVMPEHAVQAFAALDGSAFCGRMLHLLPARPAPGDDPSDDEDLSFKEKKAKKLAALARAAHTWNVLFLGGDAVAGAVAARYATSKARLLQHAGNKSSAAVRLALGETQLVAETRAFLEDNGVYLDAFNRPAKTRSKTCIIVKNLPANTDGDEIKALFQKHGHIARFLMPQHGITALVDFIEPFEAKKAFTKLAYSQFKSTPLYLEWAPENVFVKSIDKSDLVKEVSDDKLEESTTEIDNVEESNKDRKSKKKELDSNDNKANEIEEELDMGAPENNTTLFVKNLNFITNEDTLKSHFSSCGKLFSVTIARKKDPKNPGQFLSMGFGFVQYYRAEDANEALKSLQSSTLDGKTLEIKRSDKGNLKDVRRAAGGAAAQSGRALLVRNVPFQASRDELLEIFKAFGEIRSLRLPRKLAPGAAQHRGFAFVDFYSPADAKSAFEALCQSTHFYGRRLVLEWAEQGAEHEDVEALRRRTAQNFRAAAGGKRARRAAVDVDEFVESDNL